MITKQNFGTFEGTEVFMYTLDNGCGLTAEITNYGGIIKSLVYNGVDVVLGRDSLEEYLENTGYYGALIGRNSNRIKNSAFELNGKTYTLAKNDGENNLHGGLCGFDSKVWDCKECDGEEPSIILSLFSEDGEEGFPGNVNVKVTYTLTKENSIKIHYEATTDQDTIVNMTNHSYFNLNGHNSGTIDNHTLTLDSDFFTPNNSDSVPNGTIVASAGTVFNSKNSIKMGDVFNAKDDEQIKIFRGYDHNFCLNGRGFRKVAEFVGDKTGIKMETYTDLPGVQLYSGNGIEEGRVCKDGAVYGVHHAMCFETQAYPNATEFSHFPSTILKPGEKYDTTTEYKFI